MTLTPGTRLGPYEVTALIGAGGMGEVFRGRDTSLQRDVAIKVLPAAVAGDADRLARFEREAQALAALNHPNIAHIYGLEKSGLTPAIVMEFVGGEDLSVRIKRGPVLMAEALPLARQIADALSAAHEAGIIHRDLKPANIKVTDDGAVKVLDFGLAKALDPSTTPGTTEAANSPTLTNRATQLGIILGTAAYMAPEQARGKTVDKRADIWAFGVVLYEMLTGKRPFEGDDVTDVLAAVVRADPDWDALPKDTPPLIRRLLRRCLTKDPKERLHDIADARLEIEEVLNPRRAGVAEATDGRTAVGPKRMLAAVLMLAVGAFAGVAAGIVIARAFWRSDSSPAAAPVAFAVSPPPGLTLGLLGGTLSQTSRPQMAVSPDGTRVVFRAHSATTGSLYVRTLGSTDVQAVAGTDGANYPSWSPDGKRIAFCQGGDLKHIPVGGGPAQVVGPCGNPRTAAAWAGTDAFLAVPGYQGPLRARVNGQWQDALPSVFAEAACYYLAPAWLPDAQHYLIVKWSLSREAKGRACEGLYVGALGSQDLMPLISGSVEGVALVDGGIVFLQGGELTWQGFDPVRRVLAGATHVIANDVVTFSAAANTVAYAARTGVKPHRFSVGNRVAWYGRDGSGPTFSGEPGTYGDPSVSPDDRSVLIAGVDAGGRSQAIVVDRETGASNALAVPGTGVWSPNGQQVALWGGGGGVARILTLADRREQLLARPGGGSPGNILDWSADGKWLLTSGIRALSLADNREVVVGNASRGARAVFSPDQKWIAFDYDARVWVVPFPGPGARIPVSSLSGGNPRWRDDGKELYFATAPTDGERTIVAVAVTADGSSLKFGTPQPVVKAPMLYRNWAFDVTSDGKRFVAIIRAEPDPVTLTVQVGGFGDRR